MIVISGQAIIETVLWAGGAFSALVAFEWITRKLFGDGWWM